MICPYCCNNDGNKDCNDSDVHDVVDVEHGKIIIHNAETLSDNLPKISIRYALIWALTYPHTDPIVYVSKLAELFKPWKPLRRSFHSAQAPFLCIF